MHMTMKNCDGEAELLGPDVVILDSAEQRLNLHDEQIRTVLPRFGQGADILQRIREVLEYVVILTELISTSHTETSAAVPTQKNDAKSRKRNRRDRASGIFICGSPANSYGSSAHAHSVPLSVRLEFATSPQDGGGNHERRRGVS
ncbi:hypothetical protein EYF80_038705 [Liparis tanakae]|uniref:Uncharacterized protein n=1 Tax=Liparis tanakae TaxID=230148 RepID=A0A4Z2GCG9_9TELE|nr:hypothetical protein EYF80_038705 [Liparis tanakae]